MTLQTPLITGSTHKPSAIMQGSQYHVPVLPCALALYKTGAISLHRLHFISIALTYVESVAPAVQFFKKCKLKNDIVTSITERSTIYGIGNAAIKADFVPNPLYNATCHVCQFIFTSFSLG